MFDRPGRYRSHLLRYDRTGFCVARGVYGPEVVDELRLECSQLERAPGVRPANPRTLFRETETGAMALERYDPVVDVSQTFAKIAVEVPLFHLVRAVLQDNPALMKDKLIFKPPWSSGYLAHQDQAWWQLCPGGDVVTVMIAVDDADVHNGALEIAPGSHGCLLTPSRAFRNLTVRESDALRSWEVIELSAGDVLLFSALSAHRSGPNRTDRYRRALCLTYSASRHGSLYESQRNQYLEMKRAERALGKFDSERATHLSGDPEFRRSIKG